MSDSFRCLRCERIAAGLEPGVPFHAPSCPLRGKDLTEGRRRPRGPFARALDRVLELVGVTHPTHAADCPHAPHCSAATGCHDGAVVADHAQLVEERDGRWYALTWQHPRESTMHRSTDGEPMSAPPRWARK